ncbi:hypothetical protein [Natrinema sp. HArc-T2]|uniref:hypothetical protein n=1 Tax=Natrinema sp. HArc-T2 TaxID=3242701 RepID=UPI00359D3095
MIQRLLKIGGISLRGFLRVFLVILSLFSLAVGILGRFSIFAKMPSFLLHLAISVTDLREIRDDVTAAFSDAGAAAIEQHEIEGYPKRLVLDDIHKRASEATTDNQQEFEAGEFGASWLITGFAIITTHQSWGKLWAYTLAVVTLLLIVAVGVRIALIDALAYDKVPEGTTGDLLAVWLWNDYVLGGHVPLFMLSVFQFAHTMDENLYDLCIDALATSAEVAVVNPSKEMSEIFYNELWPEFKDYISTV